MRAKLPLQSHDRLKAIRMLGKQPLDAVDDQRVWIIFVGSRALHPLGTTSAFEDLKTDLGTVGLEEFEKRLNPRDGHRLSMRRTPSAQSRIKCLNFSTGTLSDSRLSSKCTARGSQAKKAESDGGTASRSISRRTGNDSGALRAREPRGAVQRCLRRVLEVRPT